MFAIAHDLVATLMGRTLLSGKSKMVLAGVILRPMLTTMATSIMRICRSDWTTTETSWT